MTTLPGYWRRIPQYYRLEGVRCKDCNSVTYPPVARCPRCGSKQLERIELPRTGRILFSTVLRQPDSRFDKARPIRAALVDLGVARLIAQITDGEGEADGAQCEVVIRRIFEDGKYGFIAYGYKFRPRSQAIVSAPGGGPSQ